MIDLLGKTGADQTAFPDSKGRLLHNCAVNIVFDIFQRVKLVAKGLQNAVAERRKQRFDSGKIGDAVGELP